MKRDKPHKFIPSPRSRARPRYKFCDTCGRQSHYYLHQPWLWRVTHKEENWRGVLE